MNAADITICKKRYECPATCPYYHDWDAAYTTFCIFCHRSKRDHNYAHPHNVRKHRDGEITVICPTFSLVIDESFED